MDVARLDVDSVSHHCESQAKNRIKLAEILRKKASGQSVPPRVKIGQVGFGESVIAREKPGLADSI
jgi:hypothetical protein